jgi:hypothetical protein
MTDDLTRDEQAQNEHALDPRERWGQGPDASHPLSAIDAVDEDGPTRNPGDRPDDDEDVIPDDMPLS